MNDHIYDDLAIEEALKSRFGVVVDVGNVIARHFPISRTGDATLFLTSKKQLYLYIDSQSKLLLSDVKKVAARIGVKVEMYMPPKGRPHYFDEIGTEKFHEVFPGRTSVSAEDIAFYRTLSPYNPALLQISEVKDGTIYQYDSDAQSDWRPVTKFSYRRIRTS
jgi:hypothetical protein